MAGIISDGPANPWWRRLQVQIELEWRLTPGALSARKWAFDGEAALTRKYSGYRVVWLRGWFRVLGLSVGAGVFWQHRKLPVE